MIDERELALWIARLETEESSWQNYERLATLYIVRDHQGHSEGNRTRERNAPAILYSSSPAPAEAREKGNSEFLRAAESGDPEKAWEIMDELMETLKVINKRVYDNVLQKLERA